MKLIHCADVHLDSPLTSRFPPDVAKERRSELLSTFRRIVSYAEREGVDGILIAGDLFDVKSRVRKQTLSVLRETVESHPGLQFFYLNGNHDDGLALYEKDSEPENFHSFGPDWKTYHIGDVAITGSESPRADSLSLNPADINLVLLHGNAVDASRVNAKDDIPIRSYAGKGIDYLALGHLHTRHRAQVDERCIACYCGCPEGRGFDECGEKGFLLLEITPDRRVSERFVPFAKRILHDIRINITGCERQEEILTKAKAALDGIPPDDMVSLTLEGAIEASFTPETQWLEEQLKKRFYCSELKIRTSLLIHPEDFQNDISLKGEFVRKVLASDLPQEDKDQIIRIGLRALWGEELGV